MQTHAVNSQTVEAWSRTGALNSINEGFVDVHTWVNTHDALDIAVN